MINKATLDSIDRFTEDFLDKHDLPGLSVCIRDDTEVHNMAFGYHDRDTGQPLSTNLLFPVMSQSKTFTAVAILKLVEQKKLNLDDPLDKFLDNLGSAMEKVTIRDALSHRTRLKHSFWLTSKMDGGTVATVEKLRDIFNSKKPVTDKDLVSLKDFKNANGINYSNTMYSVLGLIVSKVSGKSYEDFVQEQILNEHGLSDIYTNYDAIPEDKREQIPVGYDDTPGAPEKFKIGELIDSKAGNPAAGFFATPEAITNFYHKLMNGHILGNDMTEEMVKRTVAPDNGQHGLGLGLLPISLVNPDIQGQGDLIGHSGDGSGYSSETRYFQGITISVMRNRFDDAALEEGTSYYNKKHFDVLYMEKGPRAIVAEIVRQYMNDRDPLLQMNYISSPM